MQWKAWESQAFCVLTAEDNWGQIPIVFSRSRSLRAPCLFLGAEAWGLCVAALSKCRLAFWLGPPKRRCDAPERHWPGQGFVLGAGAAGRCSGPARPGPAAGGVGPVLTLYRLAVWPVRTLLNLWVRVFFLGGAPIDYSAANIVAVLRKTG